MILAVDVGNTNVVLGYLDGTAVVGRSRIVTRRDGEAAPYAAELRRSLRENGLTAAQIEGTILSSVVPEADAALIAAIREALSCDCITVRAGMRTDMPICIEEPHTLGADIIAGCVGALADYGAPLAVVDMGTATTIMAVKMARPVSLLVFMWLLFIHSSCFRQQKSADFRVKIPVLCRRKNTE